MCDKTEIVKEYFGSNRESEVASFFSGKSILITGGTGFLGKALIEKLLYSCEEIRHIFLLLRHKRGKQAKERLEHFTNCMAFERIKKEKPEVLNKIIPIVGNIASENLGLCENDIVKIEHEVCIVFHLAATVAFNSPLKEAYSVNVVGVQELMKLCRNIHNLQALVHVSTAFSNSDRFQVEEVVYKNRHSLDEVKRVVDLYSDDNTVVSELLGNKPNTYTFTKALAEEYILKEHGCLPTVIIRPSIVISSYKEPSPGWVDNWNGATGLFMCMSSGFMKVMVGRGSNVTDLVPVDIVTNLLIVAATRCKRNEPLKVYNCCTGSSNPITCNEAESITRRVTLNYGLNEIPFPFLIFTKNFFWYGILSFILEIVPSYLIDLWQQFIGKEATQMKLQRKIRKIVDLMNFFLLHQWHFVDENVRELLTSMSEVDKKLFNFDVRSLDWDKCLEVYVLGGRHCLLNRPYKL